jgi:hypothetical protein
MPGRAKRSAPEVPHRRVSQDSTADAGASPRAQDPGLPDRDRTNNQTLVPSPFAFRFGDVRSQSISLSSRMAFSRATLPYQRALSFGVRFWVA